MVQVTEEFMSSFKILVYKCDFPVQQRQYCGAIRLFHLKKTSYEDWQSQKNKIPGSNQHREEEKLQQQVGTLQEICSKQRGETRKEPDGKRIKNK